MRIRDPANEILDKEERKKNNYLVLDTLNVLSYIILTFPIFSHGETEVS